MNLLYDSSSVSAACSREAESTASSEGSDNIVQIASTKKKGINIIGSLVVQFMSSAII